MAASLDEEDMEEELGVTGVFTASDDSGSDCDGGGGIKRGGCGVWRRSKTAVDKSWEGKR